jgi:hypothetical protein
VDIGAGAHLFDGVFHVGLRAEETVAGFRHMNDLLNETDGRILSGPDVICWAGIVLFASTFDWLCGVR